MKQCSKCGRSYDRSKRFCLMDGEELALMDPYHLVGSTLLGKYRIDALVGLGGMGAVYSAHHLALNRRVAFKIMLPNLAINNQRMVDLFEREARMAGQLSHECIVDVKDAGRTNEGIAYLVMEWLEGVTLDDVIVSEGPMSYSRAGEILRQVAAALDAAHAKQVIHRDLKPANIMLASRSDGRLAVKVLDFGLARVASETADSPVSMMIGTPHYASPEQFQVGGQIDQRADLYSLGVTLFQMLTAELPFTASSFRDIIRKQQSEPPPPLRRYRADAPAALEELIFKLLAKDPTHRPQTAGDVVRRFERAILSLNHTCSEPKHSPHQTTHLDSDTDRSQAASDPTLIRDVETAKIQPHQTQKNNPVTSSTQSKTQTAPAFEARKPRFRFSLDFQWKKRRFSLLLSLGLAVVLALPIYRFLDRSSQLVLHSTSAPPGAAAPPPAPEPVGKADTARAISPRLEVMEISVEIDSPNEKRVQRVDQPISPGQAIRFHFTPRERGYLYILAPNGNNIPTTFLTAQPVSESGVKTNLIEAGQDFRFPTGQENEGVSFTKDETTLAFTIIFSPQPLTKPAFLAERANRELNGTEQNELMRLRRELESTAVQITPSPNNDARSGIFLTGPANRKINGAIMTDLVIAIERRP